MQILSSGAQIKSSADGHRGKQGGDIGEMSEITGGEKIGR